MTLGVGAFKLGAFLILGPELTYDSHEYKAYALKILAGPLWLTDVNLQSMPYPVEAWRMFGYPQVIAAAMKANVDQWPWIVVWLQAVISLYASYRFGLSVAALTGWKVIGIATTVLLGFGPDALLDRYILTVAKVLRRANYTDEYFPCSKITIKKEPLCHS